MIADSFVLVTFLLGLVVVDVLLTAVRVRFGRG